jgi:beta-glucosidase
MSSNKLPDEGQKQVERWFQQMTLAEKVVLLSGKNNWYTAPIERLGIPSLVMTDGPHGVRTEQSLGRKQGHTTAFPTGISMAATWNPILIGKAGIAMAEETKAMDCDILLGPCVNIVRHPLAGRNFESYSEDPYLAGQTGAAWVNGLQSKKVGASLKHYAANNQEIERGRGDSIVDERTLREIYLSQFEMVVKNAQPWTVMCSYNRINGEYASQNQFLLNEVLRREWGFSGIVVSDWGANHTIFESVKAGLDLEMPGPAKYYGHLLAEAVYNWQIEENAINQAVRRILEMIVRSGKLDSPSTQISRSVDTPEHHAVALNVAEEALTLLKNEQGTLPVDLSKIKKIAVIGPNAADMQVGGGGSSFVDPGYRVQPLDALRAALASKVKIIYEPGCDNFIDITVAKSYSLTPLQGAGNGLLGEYFEGVEFAGNPLLSRLDSKVDFWWLTFAPLEKTPDAFGVRWSGKLLPVETGMHTLALDHTGTCRLWLDGKLLLNHTQEQSNNVSESGRASCKVRLIAGQAADIRIEYVRPAGIHFPHVQFMFGYTPDPTEDDRMDRALKAASGADMALVFVGYPEGYESEGRDRPHMDLTGRQNELVSAIARTNPNTVVVINAGSPVTMPWVDEVKAVLLAYYPGLEGGTAISRVLLGEVNPSGKLPVTFPRRLQDTPAFINYPGTKEVRYGEGIFVGYRYYEIKDIEPLFPFGHGLSYTTFMYSDLKIMDRTAVKGILIVNLKVTNTGKKSGSETVQLYVSDRQSSLPRPVKELKGFSKVNLQPGETCLMEFILDSRAFAFYDPYRKGWIVEPGTFEIQVGSSSRDIRLSAEFEW